MATIGYIIRSYPRLSQTFIANEIAALEQLGLRLHLFPITDPCEPLVQEQVADIQAPVDYLEAALGRGRAAMLADHLGSALAAPARYLKALRYVRRRADLDEGYHAASRYECFAQALYLARLLRSEGRAGRPIAHLHAHFAHDPTLIALLVKMLTGVPYSFTAHARDLVQIGRRALVERIEQATAVITCSGVNITYIDEVVPAPLRAKVQLIHHGVSLSGFAPLGDQHEAKAEDADPAQPPLILSVGRLVEKKGFQDLLRACEKLKRAGHEFRCAIYGEGPLEQELAALIDSLNLGDAVSLAGSCSQRELIPILQRADLFALAPFVTADGDRDGIPNVLVEAMACGVAVVSTRAAGIPELVRHGENGMLVEPRDADGLAAALAALLEDPGRRGRLGAAGRQTVVEGFDLHAAARQIAALFDAPQPVRQADTVGYGGPATPAQPVAAGSKHTKEAP
jgi:glycosyltransferase involved in cell wall biosynthesis